MPAAHDISYDVFDAEAGRSSTVASPLLKILQNSENRSSPSRMKNLEARSNPCLASCPFEVRTYSERMRSVMFGHDIEVEMCII